MQRYLKRSLLRNYASVANNFNNQTQMSDFVKTGFTKFKSSLKSSNPDKFKYELIKDNYNVSFFKKYESILINESNSVENEIQKNLSNFVKSSTIPNPNIIMNYLMTPNISNLPSILQFISTLDSNKLNSLPIKLNSTNKSFVIDYIIEKLMYMKFKPYYLQFIYGDESNSQNFNDNMMLNIMDVDNPYEWFPEARKLKRKFIMHVGPTNSGKTYNALKRLESCQKGYFAGPLRLLAREVYDKFQEKNIRCNLVTGEEVLVDIDEFGNKAGLTSGTVEMLSLSDNYDVIVVDEIQMIGDEFRGSAWTNVLLGAKSKEIHLCGEKSAIPLIKKIVEMTGDDLEINEYNRLGKLIVDDEPVNVNDLQQGDCIVCFSKPVILEMKTYIEKNTGLRCAVIYGALPPETRAQEAQRFNDGYYDVVVASDAIGMGLNLKINRVIFTTTKKYNGKQNVTLSNSNIKQIGGRAGRFGIGNGEGHISAISKDELHVIKKGIEAPIDYLEKAVLWPPDGLWVKFYSMFQDADELVSMYRRFEKDLSTHYKKTKDLNKDFEIQSIDEKKMIAQFFVKNKLADKFFINDQLRCIASPCTLTSSPNRALKYVTDDLFKQFMETITDRSRKSSFDFDSMPFYLTSGDDLPQDSNNKKISKNGSTLVDLEPVPKSLKNKIINNIENANIKEFQSPKSLVRNSSPVDERLQKLEQFHKVMGTYMWLSYRFPQSFIDLAAANKIRELIEYRISEMLSNLRASNKLNKKKYKTF